MSSFRFLSSVEWAEVWASLPATHREVYWHPGFNSGSARWEQAQAQCLLLESGLRRLLYPFLRHPIVGYESVGSDLFDIQTAYGYGGPLFLGDWSETDQRAALVAAGKVLQAQGVVAEFVRCHSEWSDISLLPECGYKVLQVRTNVECTLTCDGEDRFTSDWAAVAHRNLRRARQVGLRGRLGVTGQDWAHFARLYETTSRRVGMKSFYHFSPDYFGAVAGLPSESVALLLVEAPGITEPVAAAIVFLGGRVAHHHLGASDLAHRNKCPNDFLYLVMAQEARRRGCERIVWGGGLSNDPADTLFKFKTHFGAIRKPAHIACRVLDQERYDALSAEWSRRNPDRAEEVKMFLRYRA